MIPDYEIQQHKMESIDTKVAKDREFNNPTSEELSKQPQTKQDEPSDTNALLCGTSEIKELKYTLRFLMDASRPYLQRKKMTRRSDCNLLNVAYKKASELLAT